MSASKTWRTVPRSDVNDVFVIDFRAKPAAQDDLVTEAVEATAEERLKKVEEKTGIKDDRALYEELKPRAAEIRDIAKRLRAITFDDVEMALLSEPVIFASLLRLNMPPSEKTPGVSAEVGVGLDMMRLRTEKTQGALDKVLVNIGELNAHMKDIKSGLADSNKRIAKLEKLGTGRGANRPALDTRRRS